MTPGQARAALAEAGLRNPVVAVDGNWTNIDWDWKGGKKGIGTMAPLPDAVQNAIKFARKG